MYAAGGGTGSSKTSSTSIILQEDFKGCGFNNYLMDSYRQDYDLGKQMDYVIWPSPNISDSVVEPYNAMSVFHNVYQYTDLMVLLDNEQLYKVCQKQLGLDNPRFSDINAIIANHVSSMFGSMRFGGTTNRHLKDMLTSLVPFPSCHYVTPSTAMLATPEQES